uniref:Uncharacterized protein n=1 Tax=Arion vulgaris TaxID=1028688 RepID=A0A0B6Z3X1_9EUPU
MGVARDWLLQDPPTSLLAKMSALSFPVICNVLKVIAELHIWPPDSAISQVYFEG